MTKMYITKYCLTAGIEEAHGEVRESGYFSVEGNYNLFNKNEYFESREDAENNAEERRIKKLKSLDKQIKKVSQIVF